MPNSLCYKEKHVKEPFKIIWSDRIPTRTINRLLK